MFRNKILLNNLSKYSQNQLNSKAMTMVLPAGRSAYSCFSGRSDYNFSPKLFTPNSSVLWNCKKDYSKMSNQKCWSCHQYIKLKDFSCELCGALQQPDPDHNYFEMFGISQTYDVNSEILSAKFKNLQMIFHPDKYANKSKEELEISEAYSRLLNKAYTTLKDPVARGFYILQLQKIPMDDSVNMDQEFLLSIMEKNEELDSLDSEVTLENFLKKNSESVDKQLLDVSTALGNNKWNEARHSLLKLNYLINLEQKIKVKQNDLALSKNS